MATTVAHTPLTLSPMMGVLGDYPQNESEYGFEFKWDGYRALALWDGKRLRLESRNRLDFTQRYHPLQALSRQLGKKPVVLDGEIVALDPRGRSDFSLLQKWLHWTEEGVTSEHASLKYMIFDVLAWNKRPVHPFPYRERRKVLESLKLAGPYWETPPARFGDGRALLEEARRREFEGIMAKKLSSVYEPGLRSPDWLKIKIVNRQEFVIGGWISGKDTAEEGLGSIMLGYYGPDAAGKRVLHYAGNVGTGFDLSSRKALRRFLDKVATRTSPFEESVPGSKDAHFSRPILVAEIEFRGWTLGGRVRQGSFKGLRTDKDPREVIRETKSRDSGSPPATSRRR